MIAARPDGIIATPYAMRMFQQVMLRKASSAMRRHCARGTASGVPSARKTENRMTAPPARQSVRNVHGKTSARDTFIAVELNPHDRVRPARTHHRLRGSRSSLIEALCGPSSSYAALQKDVDFPWLKPRMGIAASQQTRLITPDRPNRRPPHVRYPRADSKHQQGECRRAAER